MNILYCFSRHAVLFTSALLLCASIGAHADDIDDANKLFKQGQHNQALDKVNGYLANKPKDAQARFLKGLILTEQGKTADATKIFSGLTDDYPELPEPYNNLAVLYASQGQFDKAKLLLERAISTHPSYATAHENLGDIYAKMASQAYDRALQLDHGNTATQTKLAMIQNLFADGSRNNEAPARSTAAPGKAEETTPVVVNAKPAQPVAAITAAKIESAASFPERTGKKAGNKEALAAVKAWAAAWSAKNTDKYLSFYAADFKTPGGETRAAWEEARRERISKPKSIQIGLGNMTIQSVDGDHAMVKFRQSYRASHLKTSGNKTLLMVRSGDKWLIQEERSK
jgi:tetratricopeptide (TPR) repeat protein